MCSCVGTCIQHSRGDQRSISGIFLDCFPPCSLSQSLPEPRASWLSQTLPSEPQSSCLCLPSLLMCMHYRWLPYLGCWGWNLGPLPTQPSPHLPRGYFLYLYFPINALEKKKNPSSCLNPSPLFKEKSWQRELCHGMRVGMGKLRRPGRLSFLKVGDQKF